MKYLSVSSLATDA